jgi:hypothetical protein
VPPNPLDLRFVCGPFGAGKSRQILGQLDTLSPSTRAAVIQCAFFPEPLRPMTWPCPAPRLVEPSLPCRLPKLLKLLEQFQAGGARTVFVEMLGCDVGVEAALLRPLEHFFGARLRSIEVLTVGGGPAPTPAPAAPWTGLQVRARVATGLSNDWLQVPARLHGVTHYEPETGLFGAEWYSATGREELEAAWASLQADGPNLTQTACVWASSEPTPERTVPGATEVCGFEPRQTCQVIRTLLTPKTRPAPGVPRG